MSHIGYPRTFFIDDLSVHGIVILRRIKTMVTRLVDFYPERDKISVLPGYVGSCFRVTVQDGSRLDFVRYIKLVLRRIYSLLFLRVKCLLPLNLARSGQQKSADIATGACSPEQGNVEHLVGLSQSGGIH